MEGEDRKDGFLLFFVNCLNRGRSLIFPMRRDSCEPEDVLVFQIKGVLGVKAGQFGDGF